MKKFLAEFKDFAIRGNAIELAVGVVIGASFGAIVNSLVTDIITPLISLITGGVDFSHLTITLKQGAEPLLMYYGKFIQAMTTFTITAFAIFSMVSVLNRLSRKSEVVENATPPAPSEESVLLQSILKELQSNNNKD